MQSVVNSMAMNVFLPIEAVLPQLQQALRQGRCAVLSAPPGSGKTTRVPLALVHEPWLRDQTILLLEPRRLAARLAAGYMARTLGETVGRTVGYRIRFDTRVSARTRVEVLTEGILTRRLQQDPELAGVGLVIFDEFHERSLDSDLALALCLEMMDLRPDLRLLVMSATLETEPTQALLGQAPVIIGHGRSYPVATTYLPPPAGMDGKRAESIAQNTARGVQQAMSEQPGDILAFLPGAGEIRRTASLLGPSLQERGGVLRPLYGNLSQEEQNHAIAAAPRGRRRVILATNVAETSITIDHIDTVVDCGWKRQARFDPNTGLSGLETVRVSRAAAVQRAGRAGRQAPGVGYRLWPRGVDQELHPFDRPEILAADLASLVLELALWGVTDPGSLKWLDPPPAMAYEAARQLLIQLDALDSHNRITAIGRDMAGLPLHPRLAHMVLTTRRGPSLGLARDLAALLSERDPFQRHDRSVDLDERLQALNAYRDIGASAAEALGADPNSCRRIEQISSQLQRALPKTSGRGRQLSSGALVALAFPDRVAWVRPGSNTNYTLVSGRGAQLPSHDRLAGSTCLAVASMDAARTDGRIYLAATLRAAEVYTIFADHINRAEEIRWDAASGGVTACCATRLGALLLAESSLSSPDPTAVRTALLAALAANGLPRQLWTDKSRRLQARIACLRDCQPEAEWPDWSDPALVASLDEWLAPYLDGIRTIGQLCRLNLEAILRSRLTWSRLQNLDHLAPTHIRVPSGSRIPVRYGVDEPPVLAVRLQEIFGLAETPTICNGRLPVVLHLLSPAQRPIQITRDLKGFWDGSYHEVKKELKGRYPKHHWPDDPWQAAPTARAKRRHGK